MGTIVEKTVQYFVSLSTMEILALIMGALGIVGNVVVMQQKERTKLLISKFIANAIWMFHYLFLSAYTGFAICIIALFREIVFINRYKHKWANHIVWPIIFISAALVSAVVTWNGPISILPLAASILSVLSFWIGKPGLSRILAFPISGCMLSYDIPVGSYMGIVNEAMSLTSAVIGIIRLDIVKKKEKVAEPEEDKAETTQEEKDKED